MADAARDAVSERLRGPLVRCARGETPPNVALMQLLIEAAGPAEAEAALAAALAETEEHAESGARLRQALGLWRARPDAWTLVKAVLGEVEHDAAAEAGGDPVARWAAMFDRAVNVSPEGGVALYALGDPALLSAATAEIVERLAEWGLLGPQRTVLDLGCGIGRVAEALAGRVGAVVGLDISGAMVDEARRRCAGLADVRFVQGSGRDLRNFPDAGFDLVLAVDSFPYLVQSGPDLVERHMAEAARVLKPSGDFLILNFSYRGDAARDRADLARLAGAHGFDRLREGERAFSLWDGLAHHLRKRR